MPSGPRVSRASTPGPPVPHGTCDRASPCPDDTPRRRLPVKTPQCTVSAFENADVQVPEELLCPVLKTLIRDPVVNGAGNTYDREALHKCWAATCPELRDPLTNQTLHDARTVPNWDMRRRVRGFLDAHPGYIPDGWPDRSMPCSTRQYEPPVAHMVSFLMEDDWDGPFVLLLTFGFAGLALGSALLLLICHHSTHEHPGGGFQAGIINLAVLSGMWLMAVGFVLQKLGLCDAGIMRNRLVVNLLMYIGFVLFVIGAFAWDLLFLELDARTLGCTVIITAFAAFLEVDWDAMGEARRLSAWCAWCVAVVLLIARLTKTLPEVRGEWLQVLTGVVLFGYRFVGNRFAQEVIFWFHDLGFVLLVFSTWHVLTLLSAGALAVSNILALLGWELYGDAWRATVLLAQVAHVNMCTLGVVTTFAPMLTTNVWSLCFAACYTLAIVADELRLQADSSAKRFVSRFAWSASGVFMCLGACTWISCMATPDSKWSMAFCHVLL